MISGIGKESGYEGSFILPKAKRDEKEGVSFKDAFLASVDTESRIKSREIKTGEKEAPYSALARDSIINYNGVVFICDYERNALCLGDMSNPDDVLSIPLSGGGTLKVNRDNIDELSKAIGMFSPEDVNRILRAIAEDTQCKRKLNEIEDDKVRFANSLLS